MRSVKAATGKPERGPTKKKQKSEKMGPVFTFMYEVSTP